MPSASAMRRSPADQDAMPGPNRGGGREMRNCFDSETRVRMTKSRGREKGRRWQGGKRREEQEGGSEEGRR
eukprot:763337-Hanusia_phi.AAC.1